MPTTVVLTIDVAGMGEQTVLFFLPISPTKIEISRGAEWTRIDDRQGTVLSFPFRISNEHLKVLTQTGDQVFP